MSFNASSDYLATDPSHQDQNDSEFDKFYKHDSSSRDEDVTEKF